MWRAGHDSVDAGGNTGWSFTSLVETSRQVPFSLYLQAISARALPYGVRAIVTASIRLLTLDLEAVLRMVTWAYRIGTPLVVEEPTEVVLVSGGEGVVVIEPTEGSAAATSASSMVEIIKG